MMYEKEELNAALKEYELSQFTKGAHRVMFWLGKLMLKLQFEEAEPLKLNEVEEEPLIPNKDFCDWLNEDAGKIILYPHDLAAYLHKDKEHFAGAFHQDGPKKRLFVRASKMMQKLSDYDNTNSGLKERVREYLKAREQKLCQQTAQQLKFTDLEKPSIT